MKKVVVSGGAGFIGSNIVRYLLKEGNWEVTIIDDFSTGKKENIADFKDEVNLVKGSITDKKLVGEVLKGKDGIFHLAAIPSVQRSVEMPQLTNQVNIEGTLNLLIAARDLGVKRFVFSSSSSVYGDTEVLPKVETMREDPLSPYAVQKLTGEKYIKIFAKLYGMKTVALRYFNIFGPYQDPESEYSAVIPKFIKALLHQQRPVIFGDGEQTRDFTYISNVVEANLLAYYAEKENWGEVFNVGCGERYSLLELLDILKEYIGVEIDPEFQSPRPGDVRDSMASIEKIKTRLGFKVKDLFKEGLKKTVDYFREKWKK